MSIEKTLKINNLITVYGTMLNDRQRSIVTSYFFYDNSLSEIAENENITRQAVRDLINRVVAILENYESKLHYYEKLSSAKKHINDILEHKLEKDVQASLYKVLDILED